MAFLDSLKQFFNPQTLLGGGLALGGSLMDREPGEVLESRQALRNIATGSVQPYDPGGVFNQYEPLFRRQEEDVLGGLQTRYSAAFPANVGIQGPEVKALRRAGGELAQNRQAFLSTLALENLDRQRQAASSILQYSRPDPFASSLAQLGTLLAMQGMGGQGGGQGGFNLGGLFGGRQGAGGQQGGLLQGLFGGRGQQGGSLFGGADISGQLANIFGFTGMGANASSAAAIANQIGQMFGVPASSLGGFEQISNGAIAVMGQDGSIIATIGPQGQVINQSTGQVMGSVGSGAAGVGGMSMSSLLGALAAGYMGTQLGGALGQRAFGATDESGTASNIGGGLGALGGAALGTLLFPGVGTVVGAGLGGAAGGAAGAGAKQPDISRRETMQGALGGAFGGVGGFFASQGDVSTKEAARDSAIIAGATILGGPIGGITAGAIIGKQRGAKIEKAQFRSQDVDSQRDQVYEIGNVGADFLAQAGVDQPTMNAWRDFVDGRAATSDSPADEQGEVAGELNRLLTAAGYPPSQRPYAWRQQFIDHMISNTFTSGSSAYEGGPPLNFIGAQNIGGGGRVRSWREIAGLASGGTASRPMLAMVGERGPELAYLMPGSTVMPLVN